jgi:spore coat polysaccharide biosynthesis protein SpsF (cytidylyltransferase family)
MKDEYFEIVQGLKTWLTEKLEGYEYNKEDLRNKLDDPNYQLTVREKEGLALVKEMLDRISENTLAA